jgi:two-component system chemotaxis sensor kinase CheA
MDAMSAIKDTFFEECDEQLGELEAGLTAIERGDADPETVNAVFRAVHSIKGGAGAFGLTRLVAFAHIFETVLDLIRDGRLTPSPAVLKTLLRSADVLTDLVRAARSDTDLDDSTTAPLAAELMTLAGAAPKAAEEADDFEFVVHTIDLSLDGPSEQPDDTKQPRFAIAFRPKSELYSKGNETLRILRELERLGRMTVSCDHSTVPSLAEFDPQQAYCSWAIELTTTEDIATIQEVFEFVDGDCELSITPVEGEIAAAPLAVSLAPEPADIAAVPAAVEPVTARESQPETDSAAPAKPRAVAEKAETAPRADKGDAASRADAQQTTIRVDLERLDRLINLVGELAINQAMLSQRMIEAGITRTAELTAGLDEFEQLTRNIQESVMAIRAQPVKPLFQRMARIVREVANATGKSVRLTTEGDTTEVDRTVIERLADPLTHMLRNAVDHGLETSEKRLAAGKDEEGQIHLSAAHRSGRIVIEVSDDGAGINRPRVRDIAVKKGLIPADAPLTETEIDNLLFLPGFSTSDSVSNISGRGVGLDVVKRSIQAIGGRISINSRPGLGATFTMSLPLTLAVLDGMVIKVADQTMVIPLTAIVETLKPKPGEIHRIGPDVCVLANRGGFIPVIDIGLELGYRPTRVDPVNAIALLVETEGGARTALIVDAIHDQRQVVIKSLEANYGHVDGIAAATILGDGRIALILDVNALAQFNQTSTLSAPLHAAAG